MRATIKGKKLKRRGRKVYKRKRKCLSCDLVFTGRGHMIKGHFRAIDRRCKKCKKLMAHDFAEDDVGVGSGSPSLWYRGSMI